MAARTPEGRTDPPIEQEAVSQSSLVFWSLSQAKQKTPPPSQNSLCLVSRPPPVEQEATSQNSLVIFRPTPAKKRQAEQQAVSQKNKVSKTPDTNTKKEIAAKKSSGTVKKAVAARKNENTDTKKELPARKSTGTVKKVSARKKEKAETVVKYNNN
jgi:hypothetical protein